MKNPAEEMVAAWLQECKSLFTMNNIKVAKKGGGMGAEIDILATNGKKNIWVEVSVSINPRQKYNKEIRFPGVINDYLIDFQREDKLSKINEIFQGKIYEKWLVYGKLPLTKSEIAEFPKLMDQNAVTAISFGDILNDLLRLKHYRLDAARGYLSLFKAFYTDKS